MVDTTFLTQFLINTYPKYYLYLQIHGPKVLSTSRFASSLTESINNVIIVIDRVGWVINAVHSPTE